MAPTHSEIQEIETASSQDVEDADADLEEAWAALFPEVQELYDGPGALTVNDMMEQFDITKTTAQERARKAVREGRMAEVTIRNHNRDTGARVFITAYVLADTYNEWKDNAPT